MMRTYLALVIALINLVIADFSVDAQEPITLDVFSGGGGTYSFTSDGQYMVASRIEIPDRTNGDLPSIEFLDIFRTSDFSIVDSCNIE